MLYFSLTRQRKVNFKNKNFNKKRILPTTHNNYFDKTNKKFVQYKNFNFKTEIFNKPYFLELYSEKFKYCKKIFSKKKRLKKILS